MTDFKKVFIDTSPFIYYLENNKLYFQKMKRFFSFCRANKIEIVTSTVTIEEYLVYPYTNENMELINNFDKFLFYMNINIVNIDQAIARQAAKLRAEYKDLKAMDALQIATALNSGCDMFFTNDKQLRQEKQLPCITMDDIE